MNDKKIANRKEDIQLALLARDVSYIRKGMEDVQEKLEKDYVTQAQFQPVQKLVYGLVSLILIAVVGALLGLVILK